METHRRESFFEAGTQAVLDEGKTDGMINSGGIEGGKAAAGGYGRKGYGAYFKW